MMRYFIKHVYKGSEIGNVPNFIVRDWTPPKSLDSYNRKNHMLMFTNIKNITIIYKKMVLNMHYYIICKRKGRFLGEIQEDN